MTRRPVRLTVEVLERREVLSLLWVITHGRQNDETFPPWVGDMALAINDSVGGLCGRAEVLAAQEGLNGRASAWSCPYLLLFDQAALSKNLGTADNDEVAGLLTELVRERLPEAGTLDIHFIGHSRGAFVNRSAIERLSAEDNAKIGFLQMTSLDAQEFGDDGPPCLGSFFCMNVPANVDWADNYFQEDDIVGGERGFGALDINLTDAVPWTEHNSHSAVLDSPRVP